MLSNAFTIPLTVSNALVNTSKNVLTLSVLIVVVTKLLNCSFNFVILPSILSMNLAFLFVHIDSLFLCSSLMNFSIFL